MNSLFSFFIVFNAATKCGQNCVQQDRKKPFSMKKATASVLMSEYVLAMETIAIQLLYKNNLDYNVQNAIKFEKTFSELTLRSQVEENTGYNS